MMVRALAVATLAAACPFAALADGGAIEVTILEHRYQPPKLTIPKGATVVWVNRDQEPHTVNARAKEFRSPPLDTNDTYSHRFDQPGRFAYFCALHPQMTGEIEVTP